MTTPAKWEAAVCTCRKEWLDDNSHYANCPVFLVQSEIHQTLSSYKSRLLSEVESRYSSCTCGCNFMDGCLCKERREGYEEAKSTVLALIRNDNLI